MESGYTGISFPFRVSNRGGCVTSTTSATDPTHIAESIQQILGTNYLERPMEGDEVYSDLLRFVFEPNNETLQHLIRTRVVEDLQRLEERISCDESGVEFSVDVDDNGAECLFISITYTIIKYNTTYMTTINLGEVTH